MSAGGVAPDKITVTTKSIPRGLTARIQIDEGLIRIAGQAGRRGIQAPAAGDDF